MSAVITRRYDIRPPGRRLHLDLGALWQARDLVTIFAGRDVKLRYRQTVFGVVWILVGPTLGAAIFSFVFSTVAHLPSQHVPYFLFALVGMAGWTTFSNALGRLSQAYVSNGPLISKVYFERLALGVGTVLATLVDVASMLGIIAIAMIGFRITPTWRLVTLPLWLLALLTISSGLGLALGALTVRFRDLSPVITVGTQLLLYVSPVGYGEVAVPGHLRALFEVNPLTGLLGGLRWSLLSTSSPGSGSMVYAVAFCIIALLVGLVVFRRQERTFSDVI